jgi:methylenetetrahydrofolate dehydrogenase (NADP+) / methenyltetrahydrofolate cyclohydrolase
MTAEIIDGKKIAADIRTKVKEEVEKLSTPPGLAVVLVGSDPASEIYVRHKRKACEEVGVKSFAYDHPADFSEEDLLKLIDELNNNDEFHGILVQSPLPKHIDEQKVVETISPAKDVDGFHAINVGKLSLGDKSGLVSCTPAGIIELLKSTGTELTGKRAVVIGRSNIVGKPVSLLLLREHCTVTICHSRTKDLPSVIKEADIIVAAVGKANLVTKEMVKEGAIVIDVGMNRVDGKLYGDVDFAGVSEVASHITPVPGGVGPMTIAMLLQNTLMAKKNLAK